MLERVNLNYFNLQKMMVAVMIICLAAILFSYFSDYRSKARDVKRKADIQILMTALDIYHDKHGVYPKSDDDYKGWDVSYGVGGKESAFLPVLIKEGLVDRVIFDPLNNDKAFYRYQKFSDGSYGCSKSFYILQVINFEAQASDKGMGKCKDYDWTKLAPYGYTVQGYD
ncbi:MAG: hypothetical protein WCW25_02875 [Patescibacteria group bacterium]|jgi:hypothetical protein